MVTDEAVLLFRTNPDACVVGLTIVVEKLCSVEKLLPANA
jgi:hypothetical protein